MKLPAIRIGIDENGMGPRLGPMLVTAVWARVDERGHKAVERRARGSLKQRLGDSKELVRHGDIALGEAWARVLCARMQRPAGSVDELVNSLSLAPQQEREELCPNSTRDQCWNTDREAFEASTPALQQIEKDLKALARSGVHVLGAQSLVLCNKRINLAADRGVSRFTLDLHAMERLTLAIREEQPHDVLSVCGKVGALRQYEAVFGPLGGRLCTVLEEQRARSAYWFPGVGELRFVMDADATDRLVSLASLVGKYLREALMGRVAHFYQRQIPGLGNASGYHDPVTTKFINETAKLRKKLRVVDDCFLRRKMAT